MPLYKQIRVAVITLAHACSTVFDIWPLKTCHIQFYLVHTASLKPFHFPSSIHKHQAGRVDQVDQVKDEVDRREHRHGHVLIPHTQTLRVAAVVGPIFRPSILGVEVEDGPDDSRRQIEDHSQQGVGGQEACEGEGKAAGALAYAEQDDDRRQDEADAVDRHAVLECVVTVVSHGVADEDEDDAGHKGLADFQEAWSGRHVAGNFSRTRLAHAHLADVGDGGQAGEDGRHDAVVAGLALANGALEIIEREEDGGGQAEQGSVAGEGDGEVLPGHRGSGLQAEELHQDDEEGPGESEGPAEDAPVPGTVGELAAMHGHGEGHAGEDHGGQPCPKDGAGVENYSHDVVGDARR